MGNVRPIAMRSEDFVDIIDRIHPVGKDIAFDSSTLGDALQSVYSHLSQRIDRLDLGFTANTIVRNLVNPPARVQSGFDVEP